MSAAMLLESRSEDIKTSTSVGAYFQKIEKMRTYERTLPILYTFDLPGSFDLDHLEREMSQINVCSKVKDYESCNARKIMSLELIEMIRTIEEINEATKKEFSVITKKREKRGIQWMGDALNWCCNILTLREGEEYTKTENSLKSSYTKLRDVITKDHAALLNTTSELQIFTSQTMKNVNSLRAVVQQMTGQFMENEEKFGYKEMAEKAQHHLQMHFNNMMATHVRLMHLFQACKNHHLPSAIVKKEKLKDDLAKLKRTIKDHGYDLALEEEDEIQKYYHSKLINCFEVDNTIELEIKVPLKARNKDYKIMDFKPINFRSHNNQVCKWATKPMIVIQDEISKEVKIIDGNDLDNCNKKDSLCYLPQNRINSGQSNCAKALLEQKKYEELITKCTFECERDNGEISVQQIDKEEFTIINARDPLILVNTVTKEKEKIRINETWPGALLLSVPCTMEVWHTKGNNKSELIIPKGMPCTNNIEGVKIEHHIPLLWTHLRFMEADPGVKQSVRFHNLSQLYDTEWRYKVPHFMPIMPNQEIEKELTTPYTDDNGKWYSNIILVTKESPTSIIFTIWLVLLSIALFMTIRNMNIMKLRNRIELENRSTMMRQMS